MKLLIKQRKVVLNMNDAMYRLPGLVSQIAQKSFGVEFDGQAILNPNLQTLGGEYNPATNTITINTRLLMPQNEMFLIRTIRHELVHYLAHKNGFKDRHNNRTFAQLITQSEALPNDYPSCLSEKEYNAKHIFRCTKCAKRYTFSNAYISQYNGELTCPKDGASLLYFSKA